MQEADDDIQWITVSGSHIPIKKGQSKDDAVKDFFDKKKGEQKEKRGPEYTDLGTSDGRKQSIQKWLKANPNKAFKPFSSIPDSVLDKHGIDGNDFELSAEGLVASGVLRKSGSLGYKLKKQETIEGGPGSGVKGHTTAKDEPTGKSYDQSNIDQALNYIVQQPNATPEQVAEFSHMDVKDVLSDPQITEFAHFDEPSGGGAEPVVDPFSGPELPEEPEGGFNDIDVQAENIWVQSSPQERSALVRATMNVTPQLADDIAKNDSLSGAGFAHLGTDKAVRNHLTSQGRVVDPDTWEDDEFSDL